MRKLRNVIILAVIASASVFAAGPQYFRGSGGKDLRIAILAPECKGFPAEEDYVPMLVQNIFVGDFTKYSGIYVLDRQNLEKLFKETESGIYSGDTDFVQFGKIANINIVLTGTIIKRKNDYLFSVKITDTKTGQTKAVYNGSCTIADFDNFTGIKRASFDLLTQLGIELTDVAKSELSGSAVPSEVKAETATAKVVTAEEKGGKTAGSCMLYQGIKEIGNYSSVADAFAYIKKNAVNKTAFTIIAIKNENLAPQVLSCDGKSIDITLTSSNNITLQLASKGSLFTIENGVTFRLEGNVRLKGIMDNTESLVTVTAGYRDGEFIMNDGVITGNTTSDSGGGVRGFFTMNGGEITGNKAANYGGGVSGSVTMTGGTISGNSANYGGGVSGSFTMTGGTISGNTASDKGGGVLGWFKMSGGTVSGNSAKQGGGVYIPPHTSALYDDYELEKSPEGGIIYGNDAPAHLRNNAGGNGDAVYTGDYRAKRRNKTVSENEELATWNPKAFDTNGDVYKPVGIWENE